MIVTLLSDFGYQDNFVAIAKGIILKRNPTARILDLSHQVKPYHLVECSYLLRSAYTHFPPNTLHLSLFDIMHTCPAQLLVTRVDDQVILSADNGLLPITFGERLSRVYRSPVSASDYVQWQDQTAQFMGQLAEGIVQLDDLEESAPQVSPLPLLPVIKENSVECQIIHVDRFGNAVVNITREQFEEWRGGRQFQITILRETTNHIELNYAAVSDGTMVCFFNSAGYLEIAIKKGSASELLGLDLINEKRLFYQTVKIDFQ